MREKYESLSAVVLRDLAKARGLKNISGMKKSDLVDLMVAEDERQSKEENTKQREQTSQREQTPQREQAQPRPAREPREGREHPKESGAVDETISNLDSGIMANGILEVMPDGYGFIRCENYLPGENDVYVSPSQIRKFNLKTGDIVAGNTRVKTQQEKFSALLYVSSVNGYHPGVAQKRKNFEDLTPIFPNRRIRLERPGCSVAMRIVDLVSPIGKGQRGMIVSPPKTGKTTLLKSLLGLIPALGGGVEQGENLMVGYFEQEIKGENKRTCIEEIWEEFPAFSQYEVRAALARCGLTTKHIESQVRVLSGGEQAKVRLCKLMNRETNVLLLDEPTNHLDVDAK